MRNSKLWLTTLSLLICLIEPANAQQTPEQQLQRAQGLLRQVSAQKQELEAANARMRAEIADLEKKVKSTSLNLKTTQRDLASQERSVTRQSARIDLFEDRLSQTNERLRDTFADLNETTRTLRATEAEKNELQLQLDETTVRLTESERNNLQFYELVNELIGAYRKKGLFASMFQRDPLTGLKDVQIQNLLQEYRIKSEDLLTGDNRTALVDRAAGAGDF